MDYGQIAAEASEKIAYAFASEPSSDVRRLTVQTIILGVMVDVLRDATEAMKLKPGDR